MAATDQLERILYTLAVASRRDGVTYDELTRALGVNRDTLIKDLNEAISGEFNHPAGAVEAFTIILEDDRVSVFAGEEFKRPVRLNAREAMALGLGLRVLAADADVERRASILELASRMEVDLAAPVVCETAPQYVHVEVGEDSIREVVADAIEERRVCSVVYLKPFKAPQERRIAPTKLIYGKGRWYAAAVDVTSGEQRVFRLDRVLKINALEERVAAHVHESHSIYEAEESSEIEARVRYSERIAKWLAEDQSAEWKADGSVVITHRVADVDWLVRHVLQYGGEAAVETLELRGVVAAAAERLIA